MLPVGEPCSGQSVTQFLSDNDLARGSAKGDWIFVEVFYNSGPDEEETVRSDWKILVWMFPFFRFRVAICPSCPRLMSVPTSPG